MASSDQPPTTSSTTLRTPLVDITYKLIYQHIKGETPCDCTDSDDHIRIKTDATSYLNPRLPSNSELILCRAHFVWAKYSGDLSGVYDRAEDNFTGPRLLKETLQKEDGADRSVAETKITLFKERTQNGMEVENGGRYLRVDVEFVGSPARSAKIWGKRVAGDDILGGMKLSREEKLRLGIEGKKWTWRSD